MSSGMKVTDSELKLPKQRDFLPAKKYREAVKKWGEPTKLLRKRVIIVPSIKSEARDVDVQGYDGQRGLAGAKGGDNFQNQSTLAAGASIGHGQGMDADSLSSQEAEYKTWLAERKKLRSILNSSGLNQDWLAKKKNKTSLENRVLKRMKLGGKPEIRVKKVLLPPVGTEEEDNATGVDKGIPVIKQPSPAALAMIQEYIDNKKMRLVDLFAQADKDKNWIVSRDEFRRIIRASGIPITEVDLEDLIMSLDKDENDALNYRELSVGRQAYLEERIESKSISKTASQLEGKGPNLKIPESVKEEPEDASQSPTRQTNRPSSPHRPSSPRSPSPTALERPDSSPARPGSPMSQGSLSRSNSSPSLLGVPPTEMSEKVERSSQDQMKEKRIKKRQKRKEKEKAKQKKKAVEKPMVAPSTLRGTTGEMIDRYRNLSLKEYHATVELCELHGVKLSKALLGRVLLQPEDKPVTQCIPRARPGLFAITTRHHVPATHTQIPGSQRGTRPPKTGPDWIT